MKIRAVLYDCFSHYKEENKSMHTYKTVKSVLKKKIFSKLVWLFRFIYNKTSFEKGKKKLLSVFDKFRNNYITKIKFGINRKRIFIAKLKDLFNLYT